MKWKTLARQQKDAETFMDIYLHENYPLALFMKNLKILLKQEIICLSAFAASRSSSNA